MTWLLGISIYSSLSVLIEKEKMHGKYLMMNKLL